jgi:CHRD domain
MSVRRTTAVAVMLAGAVGGLAVAGGAGAAAEPQVLMATLSGEEEVPEGGQGSGTARLTLDPATGRVCFNIRLQGVGRTAAGHIHKGGKGVAGDVVVPLYASVTRRPRGCAKAPSTSIVRQILQRPGRYYVNVHTAAYPGGAARGQLQKP